MRKNQKRNADGTFAADLLGRIKKAKKSPEVRPSAPIPFDRADDFVFPNTAAPAGRPYSPDQAATLAEVFESALSEPKTKEDIVVIHQNRRMLENVFGPINWDK